MTEVRQRLADDEGTVLSGAIRTCSIVPRSFSRTTDNAVEITGRDHPDVGDQSGDEEQRAAQLRVVPDARFNGDAGLDWLSFDRRGAAPDTAPTPFAGCEARIPSRSRQYSNYRR